MPQRGISRPSSHADSCLVRPALSPLFASSEVALVTNGRVRLPSAWEGSPFGVGILDLDGRMIETNPAMRTITGYEAAELERMYVTDYTHSEDVEESTIKFRRLVAGDDESYRIETRLVR